MDGAVWGLLGVLFGVCATLGGLLAWLKLTVSSREDDDLKRLLTVTTEPIAYYDSEEIIGYSNDAFQQLTGSDPTGASLDAALSDHPDLYQQVTDGGGTAESATGTRYTVSVTAPADVDGSLVLFHEASEAAMEHEAEKLDKFASLVSHDLRNPLDVAIGRTNAVSELNDDPGLDPHLESTQQALHRMQDIITGVLVVASQGDAVGEVSAVELDELAEQCWEHVDTDTATLHVETTAAIEANPDALLHVFENLFRNAIDHGGPDVRVTVGELSDGFFIEDDGPGIPDAKRGRFREPGETGSDSGTGLGLAIVDNITDAHNWDLSVTESQSGGARFEFSNVTVAPDACAVNANNE
ncbi:Signal transduction histidine kinase [Halovenus aranensis]|uniref:histidine kinase n=1 Tax=Halovenus aranensis TaxID=890420 RepID=A0A1G8W461_9EURY|nr:HAMP domain-containing sensor histidine kinase [Halovenus aranensis]SDJ73098.1 Signal transduction histidine kinase [Halovenus aranensis]